MVLKYYRFLNKKDADDFVNKGTIYFNNLEYYKNYEEENDAIKDINEGLIIREMDSQNSQIFYDENLIEKEEFIPNSENIIDSSIKEPENIFIFCLTNEYSKIMYDKFNVDCCVEINNINTLKNRIKDVLPSKYNLDFGKVKYYKEQKNVDKNIPLFLLKKDDYNYQKESRFYFHIPYLYKKTKTNFKNKGQFKNLEMYFKVQSLKLELGNLSDICKIKKLLRLKKKRREKYDN